MARLLPGTSGWPGLGLNQSHFRVGPCELRWGKGFGVAALGPHLPRSTGHVAILAGESRPLTLALTLTLAITLNPKQGGLRRRRGCLRGRPLHGQLLASARPGMDRHTTRCHGMGPREVTLTLSPTLALAHP